MSLSILFVCSGNICRSPAVAAALKKRVVEKGLEQRVFIDSCAVTSWFLGASADERMVKAAKARNIPIDHKAKLFEEHFFQLFDYIFAVDKDTLKRLQSLAKNPADRAKIQLATAFSSKFLNQEILDPYRGSEAHFEIVMDMAEDAAEGIFESIIMHRKASSG